MSPPPIQIPRDFRLDLFRGLSLWLIFLDHIPSNVISWITIRNYGFSDAAEIFVFISGYVNAYVYGEVMRQRGFVRAAVPILKRAWQLYAAQILLFAIYVGVIAYIAGDRQHYADQTNIARFFQHPDVLMLQVLLLKYKPLDLDPLPLYFAFLLAFPAVLWLLRRLPDFVLALSVILYAAAKALDWNLPEYQSYGWYFNPFAWQLMFVIGAWCALGGTERHAWLVHSRLILGLAGLYLLFSLFMVMSWNFPQLAALVPQWAIKAIYPIDKGNLDVLRVLHFLALAAFTVWLIPSDWQGLKSPILQPAILCGQHSLEVFALGVLLSFVGHFATLDISGSIAMQVLVSAAGIAAMIGMAAIIDWSNSLGVPFQVVSQHSHSDPRSVVVG